MAPDDEILFGRVLDETHSSYERVEGLRGGGAVVVTAELAVAVAEFQLHGATLRLLRRWYPLEDRVREALADWEILGVALSSRGLTIEA